MTKKNDFVEYVVGDLLAGIRGVRARAMFGGHGIYKDDTIFGIVIEDVLYFKADASNRAQYEKLGSKPFTYLAKGSKKVSMSYWEVPAEVLEDRENLEGWASKSILINRTSTSKAKR